MSGFVGAAERPLRVLQVTPRYWPSVGGVETHVREVTKRLPRFNIDPTILAADEHWCLSASDVVDGVPVHRVRAHPRHRDWMIAPGLAGAIRASAPDVVHVQSYHTFLAPTAMALCGRLGIPYALTFHGGGHSASWRNAIRSLQLRALGLVARRAAAFVAIAEFEQESYPRLLGVDANRFVYIPNGAELPHVDEAIRTNGRLIVSLGRLEAYKGHHRVLAAFPHVLRKEPDARLWIAGNGPNAEALGELAETLGVSGSVEIGAAERSVLARRLRGASAVVLLSDFESHPLAVLEAASLGVPAVVADNSGMSELARKGYATAVPTKAPPEVHAATIVRAMNAPGPSGVEIPTWDGCVASLAALYRRIASAASG